MAWNKPVTNREPATQTDEGPYDTTRMKGADGRYTANPDFNGNQKQVEKELNVLDKHGFNDRAYSPIYFSTDRAAKAFDEKICVPLFEQYFSKTVGFMHNYTKCIRSTSFEDINLGIDYFCLRGKKDVDTEKAFLLFSGNYTTVDLKTMTNGLGDRDFYNKPNLSLTVRKVLSPSRNRPNYQFDNQLSKHLNGRYVIQVPFSDKKQNDPTFNIRDIQECKIYSMPSGSMKEAIAKHNEPFMDKCMEKFDGFLDRSDDEIKQDLEALAQENGYEVSYSLGEDNVSRFRVKGQNEEFLFKILKDQVQGLIIFPMKEFENNPKVLTRTFSPRY